MLKSHALAAALCAAVLTATSFAADFCLTLDPNDAQASKLCSVYPGAPEPKVENAMYSLASLKIGDTVTFLTPQGELKGSVTYAVKDVNGIVCRAGNLDDFAGQWRIAAGPNVLFGVVEDLKADARYEINGTKKQGVYEVKECSYSERCAEMSNPEDHEAPVWEESSNSVMGARVSDLTPEQAAWAANWDDDEVVELTIAVIFSNLSIESAGSLEAANTKVAAGIAVCNQAMQNSQINAKLTCVGTYLCDYEETKDSSLDLSRMQQGIDGFEFVPDLRNKLGADFVCYAPRYMTPGWAGLGYVHGSPTGAEGCGFHIVLYSYLEDLSWVHEWGHNMGCNHSAEQTSSPGPEDGGLFGHSLGCYFYATNLTQRCLSIMTYHGSWNGQYYGYRVPYFSEQFLNYGGSAVYYNSKTRCATVWQKIRKYASLYRTPPVLSEFNCGFEADEGFYLGDATWQQGILNQSATGTINESSGNYYLHSQGGNGFQVPVNVKSDNGFGTYKVSVRVNPTFGGTYFDIRGAKDALCYVYVTSSGSLNLACSSTPGGTVSKATVLQQISTGWQEWTFFIEESTKQFVGWSVNGEYHSATECYVAGEDDVYVSSVWLKDVSSGGADFDDVHVDSGIGDLSLNAEPMAIGSNMTTVKLSNLNENTTIKYKAKVVKGEDNFTISPVEGLFKEEAEIRVEAHDLPTAPQFLECVVEVDAGNAGKKRIRLGAPCGNETDGYGFYSADLSSFPKGSPGDYDSRWGNSGTLDYAFDHYVTEVLLDEDFESYPGNTNMGGIGGWSSGYGTIDRDGSIYVRERFGNKYCEVAYVNNLFGAHKKLDKQMKPHWWEGHTKGYFRISFDAMLTGTSSKFFGLWDPQMVEGNFEYVNGSGYRFRSNASDANHTEFVSQNYISQATWTRVSMIIEAVPVLDSSERYRHILRQYKVDGKTENCKAFLDQDSNNDCFNTLRFFLWGSGTFCLDNLKVETLISETDYDILDFADVDPMDLYFNSRQDVEVNLGFTEEMARNYDITIAAKMMLPTDFGGTLTFGQDDFHKQFATEFKLKSGKVSLNYPNAKGVQDTFTADAGEWFEYGYDISTTEKNLRRLFWDGDFYKENLPITGADATTAIDKIKFSVSSGQARVGAVDAKLTPRKQSVPILSLDYDPITFSKEYGTISITNELPDTTATFSVSFEDSDLFMAEPSSGTFQRFQTIKITPKNLPAKAEYAATVATIDLGEAGKGTFRVGAPCGTPEKGYEVYNADFATFPQGDPRFFDRSIKGEADVQAQIKSTADWEVFDTLLTEDFEKYENSKDLCGEDNWSVAYGAIDVNGTTIVKEENGNKYLRLKDITGLFGIHKKLDKTLDNDWVATSGKAKGFFKVSFKARLGGTTAKNLGLWTPQCVETQFRYDNGAYRFASNKSDETHPEFVSDATIAIDEWTEFSAVFSADTINDSEGHARHVLRQVRIGNNEESGEYLCDQENETQTFSILRFFQWGEGTFDIDDLKVEAIVTDRADASQTFSDGLVLEYTKTSENPTVDEGGLFYALGIGEGIADMYDLEIAYKLLFTKTPAGDLTLTQDSEHRQMKVVISRSGDTFVPTFTDYSPATALATARPAVGEAFDYAVKVNTKTGNKQFREFTWAADPVVVDAPITSGSVKATEGVDALRMLLSTADDSVCVESVSVKLTPVVPEPTTLLLLLALLGLGFLRRK